MISNLNKSSAVDPTLSQNDPQAVKIRKGKSKDNDGSLDDASESTESNDTFSKKLEQAGAIATQPTTVNLSKAALGLGVHAEAQGPNPSAFEGKNQTAQASKAQRPVVAVGRSMESASFSPTTAKQASGVNAGSSIAGLKPWNQDWVLEGLEQPTPENAQNAFIRPLIGGKSAMDELSEFSAAQKALVALKAEAEKGNPGATQVMNDLRMRGVEGQLKANLNGQLDGDPEAQGASAMAGVNARLASQLPGQLGVGGVSQQASSQDLAQAMAQLNGKAINTDYRAQEPEGFQNPASKLGGKGGASGLSGGEFLNTLTLVRPGQQALNGDTVEAIGTRPAIQVSQFEGLGGKKKSSGFPEDSISNRMLSSEMLGRSSGQNFAAPTASVIGHVVPGAMAQDQLSHEAVLNVSNSIKSLGQGVGEMKIHLKPDNLGELHLKVMTRGQDVGIQILASDENAKKVLQDSMSTLKDSLASQNLNLGKVELSVAKSFGAESFNQSSHDQSGNSSNSQSQQNHQGQQFSSNWGAGQNANQQNQGNRWTQAGDGSSDEAGVASPLKMGSAQAARLAMASGGRSQASANDGRLDVLA
jgi:flagellar hook-length control protein FliK